MDERQFDQPEPGVPGGDDLAGSGSSRSIGGSAADRPIRAARCPSERPPAAEMQHLVDALTASARVRATTVALETAALVDAVAALRPLEAHYGMRWRQWVAWQCGLTRAEARRVCLLAEKLPGLPLLDARFRSGALSDGVVEKLARVATPANEAEVLAAAEVATGPQLEQVVRDFRVVRKGSKPPPGASVEDPATMPSEASWGWDDRGRFRGSWDLRADDGAVVEAALDLALSRFRQTEEQVDGAHPDGAPASSSPGAPPTDTPRPDAANDEDAHRDPADDPVPDPEAPSTGPSPTDPAGRPDRGAGGSGVAEGELRPDEKPSTRAPDALVAFANLVLAGHADDGLLPESVQIILHHNLTPTGSVDRDGVLRPDPDPRPSSPSAAATDPAADVVGAGHDNTPATGGAVDHQPAPDAPAPAVPAPRAPAPGAPVPDGIDSGSALAGGPTSGAPDPGAPVPDGLDSGSPPVDGPAAEAGDRLRSLCGAVLPGCGALPDWLAQKLACDALQITIEMIGGFPVSEPTAERSFNRSQRRAQRARDRHCRFPGCTRTKHLHAHHTRRWSVTRRSSVADSVLLCEQHHTLVHLRGYEIALGVDRSVTVTRPDGTVLRGTPMPPPADAARRGSGPRPDDPRPDRRHTGTREPLTFYARDILATSWHHADLAGADPSGAESFDADPFGADPSGAAPSGAGPPRARPPARAPDERRGPADHPT